MKLVKSSQIKITDPFWQSKLELNSHVSIIHQWQMLEKWGSVDNFRYVAKIKEGFRKGYFYTDSDVHKWAEAASLVLLHNPNLPELQKYLTTYIEIIEKAQTEDGYLFTYNQFHFPNRRWANLSIEHELYCMGHLIEAGIAHFKLISSSKLFLCAVKAANLIVKDFLKSKFKGTPGHPEIELALLKLYQITQNQDFFTMAQTFIEKRGKTPFFGLKLAIQNSDQSKRANIIKSQQDTIAEGISTEDEYGFMETMNPEEQKKYLLRSLYQFLTGKYFQENKGFLKRREPEGHAVRFGYFQTAIAKWVQYTNDTKTRAILEKSWRNMIEKHMYITGGLGAVPLVEGFGRAYELPNDFAYCETCAGIASIFWTWEMYLLFGKPVYLDVLELQLYNATLVGMGPEGKSYFYRNVLESSGEFHRKEWYKTPCCPSNISRLWEQIRKYIYSVSSREIFVNLFIGNTAELEIPDLTSNRVKISMENHLFDKKSVSISLNLETQQEFAINFRIPNWSQKVEININGNPHIETFPKDSDIENPPASGLNPFKGNHYKVSRLWNDGDQIELHFTIPIKIHTANRHVKANKDHVAISYGPLIYCLESTPSSLEEFKELKIAPNITFEPFFDNNLDTCFPFLQSGRVHPQNLTLIPYFKWGKQKGSKMKVWIPTLKKPSSNS